MNERIKELENQATIHSPEGFYTYTQIDAEKFAELLVRECADICDDNDNFLQAKIIKKHFGVEE